MRRFTALAAGLLFANASFAGPDQVLLKAAEAARSANYQGVIIYRSGSNMESMRLVHGVINGAEHERISALTGEMREVIRDKDRVICLMPNDRKADFRRPQFKGLLAGLSPELLQRLATVYALKEIGNARIAGRNCKGIEFIPRDGHRYRYEIWADEATNVPLRVALTTVDRQVLEEVMFTEVSFPAVIPARVFEPESDIKRYRVVSEPTPGPAQSVTWDGYPLRLPTPPQGYVISARDTRPARGGRGVVEHIMLSDGLSAISIFAAPAVENKKGFAGLTQRGGIHAYGRAMGNYHVTVVGETPAAAVRAVAEGLVLTDAAP